MPGKEERIRQDNGRRRRQKRRRGGASRGGGGSTSDDDGDDEIQFKTMVDCSFCWGLFYFVSRSFGLCLVSFQVSIFLSIFKCWCTRVYQIHGRLEFFFKDCFTWHRGLFGLSLLSSQIPVGQKNVSMTPYVWFELLVTRHSRVGVRRIVCKC